MKTKHCLIPGTAALLVFAGSLAAQVPPVLSYQGRVHVSGADFSGPGQFKFALVSPGTNVSRRATAMATVTSGFVTGITVTVQSAGIGYSASPGVTIALPTPSYVHGTYCSKDNTSSAGSEPVSTVLVPVQQGLFTVFLGDTNLPNMQAVPPGVFTQSDAHLRLWFSDGTNDFAQLSPDQRIGSVGYALIAAQVGDAAINAASLADMSVTTEKLAAGAVTSERIEDGTISAADISPVLLNDTFWNLAGNRGTTPRHPASSARPLRAGDRAITRGPRAPTRWGVTLGRLVADRPT